MAHRVEKRLHPATGEIAPDYHDAAGEKISNCANCGEMPVALNGVLCKFCLNQGDIRSWYGTELAGRDVNSDLDASLEEMLTFKPTGRRVSSALVEDQERRASSPRLKPDQE